jgi:ATP-binding cassette subfamily B protein
VSQGPAKSADLAPSSELRAPWRTVRLLLFTGFAATPFWMLVTLGLSLGTALCSVFYPVGIKVLVDAFVSRDRSGIVLGAVLVSSLYSLGWILSNNTATTGVTLSDHVNLYLSRRIARLVNQVSELEHLERPAYLLELDLLDDNRNLLANGSRQAVAVLAVAVQTAGIVVLLATVWWPLALLPLISVLPTAGERWSVRIRQGAEERVAEERRLANELFAIAAGAEPAKELRAYGLGPELARRHREAGSQVSKAIVRAALLGGGAGATGWLLFAVCFGLAVVAVAVRAAHGEATAGQVVLAVTLVQRAQFQVAQATNAVGQLLTMGRTARRLFWLEDYAARESGPVTTSEAARRRPAPGGTGSRRLGPEPADGDRQPVPATLGQGIRFDHVSFSYPGRDDLVLDDVVLELPAGRAVAIVGNNGAGKTSLVKLLTRMYQPSAGRILVDGIPLADLDPRSWRQRTSAAFQDFVRPELLLGETVGIGDLEHLDDEAVVDGAMRRSGASDVAAAAPGGRGTPLGRSFPDGHELSGGQWQKLALGRSLMRAAPLLVVLDEPTASLDALAEHALFERYLDAARQAAATTGAITILVSHRFSTVAHADLIVVIDGGRVAEVGTHQELMERGGTYAELYELQATAYR